MFVNLSLKNDSNENVTCVSTPPLPSGLNFDKDCNIIGQLSELNGVSLYNVKASVSNNSATSAVTLVTIVPNSVSGPSETMCFLTKNSNVYCWGNFEQQFGSTNSQLCSDANVCLGLQITSPQKIDYFNQFGKVLQVEVNEHLICALIQQSADNKNAVYCVGSYFFNQAQINDFSSRGVSMDTLNNSCVVKPSTGKVNFLDSLKPIQIALTTVNTACALMQDGSVYCWGVYDKLDPALSFALPSNPTPTAATRLQYCKNPQKIDLGSDQYSSAYKARNIFAGYSNICVTGFTERVTTQGLCWGTGYTARFLSSANQGYTAGPISKSNRLTFDNNDPVLMSSFSISVGLSTSLISYRTTSGNTFAYEFGESMLKNESPKYESSSATCYNKNNSCLSMDTTNCSNSTCMTGSAVKYNFVSRLPSPPNIAQTNNTSSSMEVDTNPVVADSSSSIQLVNQRTTLSCSLSQSNEVQCWGKERWNMRPFPFIASLDVAKSATKDASALTNPNQSLAWITPSPLNSNGALSLGTNYIVDRFAIVYNVRTIPLKEDKIVALHGTQNAQCAIFSDGKLQCWGGVVGMTYSNPNVVTILKEPGSEPVGDVITMQFID